MSENQHGGARPRAGRKPKKTKYELSVTAAEDKIIDHLPAILDNLLRLANGGFEVVENKWMPRSAFSLGDVIAMDAGKDSEDAQKAIDNPNELVLSERKTYYALPDRAANIYLVDRILGKPTQRQDLKIIKPPKPLEEMTVEELDAYIAATTGTN
jgi:hypothetical protein